MLTDDLETVRKAARGLMYPSESDYPLDVVTFPASAASATAAVEHIAERRGNLQEVPPQKFWSELQGVEGAEGFAALRQTMESILNDLAVIRIGEVQIDV